ncbi:MAG: HAD family hydrolase [Chloroflexota bacterium]
MLKALIFDFDGLILDTETPEFETWQAIYREHSAELSIHEWGQFVGGNGASDFDPVRHLEKLAGRELDDPALRRQANARSMERILSQPVLPGVLDWLDSARSNGIPLAVASSSPHSWVDPHLSRLGLAGRFDEIVCADDVSRTKPAPDLFIESLRRLRVRHDEAAVFEDSPNGVKAAKTAGLFVVAIPNPITSQLGDSGADITLSSLAELSLTSLMKML